MPYPNKWGVNSGIALFRLDRLRETGWAVAIDNIMTQVRPVVSRIFSVQRQGLKACLATLCTCHIAAPTHPAPSSYGMTFTSTDDTTLALAL